MPSTTAKTTGWKREWWSVLQFCHGDLAETARFVNWMHRAGVAGGPMYKYAFLCYLQDHYIQDRVSNA